MDDKLLPCPFCGGEADIEEISGNPFTNEPYTWAVGCKDCNIGWYKETKEDAIAARNRRAQPEITGETSDGYHTFNELYHHRAVLFSVICNSNPEIAWKSKLHHDGTMYDGMFIVGVETPDGQATYHYDIDPYWEMFDVQELPKAPEWDGHTPTQAIERIGKLRTQLENSRQHALQTGVCPMCEDCPDGCPVETPKDSRNIVTNADRIRSMSDEELAEFITLSPEMEFDVCLCCKNGNPYPDDRGICLTKHGHCEAEARCEALKDWLKQPVKEECKEECNETD